MGHLRVGRPTTRETSGVVGSKVAPGLYTCRVVNTGFVPRRESHSRQVGAWVLAWVVCCATILINVASGSAAVRTSGSARQMIVILRDQNSSLTPRSAARNAAVRTEQAPIVRSLRESGAKDISSLSVINALVVRMSPEEARLLAADPTV